MPIPAHTIDGVLPPYVGPLGPGGPSDDMSPYSVTAVEVVVTLGSTDQRRAILRNWLRHRAALRGIGFDRGFQWLDGSFVENKDPKDLDVVAFLYRPPSTRAVAAFAALVSGNLPLLDRNQVKVAFDLDLLIVDLDGSIETVVNITRYYLGLFSHRRGDDLWKGMLQVRLEDIADDTAALAALGPAAGGVTP